MKETLPGVTIIIAARPEQSHIESVAAGRQLDYPDDRLEIIVARGRQPSVQRNAALRAAKGELVYFLDDDSVPDSSNLRRAVAHFAAPEVVMAGGPNLCPADAPPLEQSFAMVMGTPLAFGPSSARYRRAGELRATSEKELILCNLVARKAALIEAGGFNEALYPNEENALMDALQRRGGKLLYDPGVVVWRRPRPTVRGFCRMLLTYGRGRAEQFRAHPTPGSILNFVPPLFLAYLLALPWLGLAGLWVLAPYVALVLVQAVLAGGARRIHWAPWLAVLIMLTHSLYGAGFWRGLFTRPGKEHAAGARDVQLETVSLDRAPS